MTTKQKEYIEFIEEFSGVKFKGNPNSNKDISEYIVGIATYCGT